MTASAPSEDDVRAKAFELWLAGGMAHGRDQDDWFRAEKMLTQSSPPGEAAQETATRSMAQVMVGGVLDAAQLAVSTAASAIGGMLGSLSPDSKTPKPEADASIGAPAIPNTALEAAEQRLQVEAEKRIREAKTEAAATTTSDEEVSKAKVNPDG